MLNLAMGVQWVAVLLLPVILTQDLTRTDRASGFEVVDAVVNSIRESCLFSDDKLFLRRVSYVASQYGVASNTYRPGYYGGIWQLDQDKFMQTKSSPAATAKYAGIQTQFGIDWSTVGWVDLLKPLYSGLAAALYLETLSGTATVPRGIEDQAAFYAQYYSKALDAAHQYLIGAQGLQQGCQRTNLDLVFVVDTSSSLALSDFNRAKDFTSNIVDAFKIGRNDVRVAYLTFSNGVSAGFYLSDHFTNSSVKAAIHGITYHPGHTDTDLAIAFAANQVFTTSKGSRDGSSKVILLITDGRSEDRYRTIQAAKLARAKGIILYSIGVGSVDKTELDSIASEPVCTHSTILKGYSDLKTLTDEIQQVSCRAPAILKPGTYHFTCGQSQLFQIPPQATLPSLLTTIGVSNGRVDIYGSFINPTPNAAFNSFHMSAVQSAPAAVFLKDESRPLYLMIKASGPPSGCTGTFTIGVGSLHVVIPSTVVTCDKTRRIYPCNVIDILKELFHYINPPYSTPNRCPSFGRDGFFIHPTYQTQFVYCLHGQQYIFGCPPQTIFDISHDWCILGVPSTPPPTTPPPTTHAPRTTSVPGAVCPCPLKDGDLFYYPYSLDPHKYIHCDQFCHAYLKTCPYNRVWKQAILQCVPSGFLFL